MPAGARRRAIAPRPLSDRTASDRLPLAPRPSVSRVAGTAWVRLRRCEPEKPRICGCWVRSAALPLGFVRISTRSCSFGFAGRPASGSPGSNLDLGILPYLRRCDHPRSKPASMADMVRRARRVARRHRPAVAAWVSPCPATSKPSIRRSPSASRCCVLREQAPQLRARHHALEPVRLAGARRAAPESDIDLLIEVDPAAPLSDLLGLRTCARRLRPVHARQRCGERRFGNYPRRRGRLSAADPRHRAIGWRR